MAEHKVQTDPAATPERPEAGVEEAHIPETLLGVLLVFSQGLLSLSYSGATSAS